MNTAFVIGTSIAVLFLIVLIVFQQIYIRMQKKLSGKEREAALSQSMIDNLTQKYESVYIVNLSTDEISVIKRNEHLDTAYGGILSYSKFIDAYIKAELFDEDAGMFRTETTIGIIKSRLENTKSYDVEYRYISNASLKWRRMSIGYLNENEISLCFMDCDTEMIRQFVEEKLRAGYSSIFLVNADNGAYRFVYRKDNSLFPDVKEGDYDALMKAYAADHIPLEHRQIWIDKFLLENVKTILAQEGRCEYSYPILGAHKHWRRSTAHVVQRRGMDISSFVVTFTTLDAVTAENIELTQQLSGKTLELEEQQTRLEEALQGEEDANRAKSDFLFNMSHDIRTPLNAIIGYSTMAKKHVGNETLVLDYLNKIGIAGENLLELINHVLDMAKIEAGKVSLNATPNDLLERAEALFAIARPSASAKNITIQGVVKHLTHSKVYADTFCMNQIMTNILGNAIKYTPDEGRIVFTIEQVPCDQEGYGKYVFTIEDNGIGMDESFLNQIFEPFSRERNTTESRIEGTGLGMPIVKNLVELLGGEIAIASKRGVGTTVTITMLLKLLEQEEHEISDVDFVVPVNLKGKRVLLAEDNEMNREIATALLEEAGLIVEVVEDGKGAVEKMKTVVNRMNYRYYDFILMDIQMPVMNGYEATKAIRALAFPDKVHVPIIAMTANAFDEDRMNALAAGMDDHLPKPIDIQKVLETLSKYVSVK